MGSGRRWSHLTSVKNRIFDLVPNLNVTIRIAMNANNFLKQQQMRDDQCTDLQGRER